MGGSIEEWDGQFVLRLIDLLDNVYTYGLCYMNVCRYRECGSVHADEVLVSITDRRPKGTHVV